MPVNQTSGDTATVSVAACIQYMQLPINAMVNQVSATHRNWIKSNCITAHVIQSWYCVWALRVPARMTRGIKLGKTYVAPGAPCSLRINW